MVPHREDVGQHLGRVPVIGEPVPDGDASVPAEGFDVGVRGAPVLDPVEHPSEHAGRVLDGLLVSDL